jgi:hypothetical protein
VAAWLAGCLKWVERAMFPLKSHPFRCLCREIDTVSALPACHGREARVVSCRGFPSYELIRSWTAIDHLDLLDDPLPQIGVRKALAYAENAGCWRRPDVF